jgi:uncharacterized protein (TIGR00369 family)
MGLTIEKINEVSRNTMAETLEIKVIECSKERIVATMPVDARHHQPMGLLHGGASVALAETVASIGGWSHVIKEGKVVVGLEINANHLRQVRSGLVTAIGTPIHLGRTSQVWDIKIYNEEKELVCISRCTLAVIVPR